MSDNDASKRETRSFRPRPAAEPIEKQRELVGELDGEPQNLDPDGHEELAEDIALAREAAEEYEAKGLEDTIPYSEYRAKWLGTAS